jgi:hypothetical protein
MSSARLVNLAKQSRRCALKRGCSPRRSASYTLRVINLRLPSDRVSTWSVATNWRKRSKSKLSERCEVALLCAVSALSV